MPTINSIDAALRGYRETCEVCKGTYNVNARAKGRGWRFICGDCEYREIWPEAAPVILLPRERRPLPLQTETLF
jgi:hypothetical protein